MSDTTLVTVIVPTHNHSETLSYSVQSICEQTISNIEIVIIGDGVTDDVRHVAQQLCASDPRISFVDHPKTPRRGELLRNTVIRESQSTYIAYNCDDDLWFPHHLETLLTVIKDAHFTHPLPVLIGADGVPFFMPSDLSRRESVEWHLSEIPRNTISLSGVMHTRESYLRLPYGWRETPVGRWTDHYMWQQFFEQEWFQGVTSPHATTLKLMAQGRDDLTSDERKKDIENWWHRLHSAEFQQEWNRMVRDAMWKSAVDHLLVSTWREDEITQLRVHIAALENEQAQLHATFHEMHTNAVRLEQTNHRLSAQLVNMENRLKNIRERLDSRRHELEKIHESTSWKITKPLRAIRKVFR
jgi:glycosyltransferase involved in cell wall biosynthesis